MLAGSSFVPTAVFGSPCSALSRAGCPSSQCCRKGAQSIGARPRALRQPLALRESCWAGRQEVVRKGGGDLSDVRRVCEYKLDELEHRSYPGPARNQPEGPRHVRPAARPSHFRLAVRRAIRFTVLTRRTYSSAFPSGPRIRRSLPCTSATQTPPSVGRARRSCCLSPAACRLPPAACRLLRGFLTASSRGCACSSAPRCTP